MVVARVGFDAGPGRQPWVDRTKAEVVVEDCDVSNLAFSHDGRWLYYVPNNQSSRLVRRVAVPRLDHQVPTPGPLVATLPAGL